MKKLILRSDQLNKWSDNDKRFIDRCAKRKTRSQSSSFTKHGFQCAARLSYRTVQTMWKARLQMRQRTWPWTQVLSFHQFSWPAPRNGLCPLRRQKKCRNLFRKFKNLTSTTRGNYSAQFGIIEEKRSFLLRRAYDSYSQCCPPSCRNCCWNAFPCYQNFTFKKHTQGGGI